MDVRRRRLLDDLLAQWNLLAWPSYTPAEISRHQSAVSTSTFVRQALSGRPHWVDDLSFDEARGAVEGVGKGGLSEVDAAHVMNMLEVNLPGADLWDLMHYPNVWFGDETMFHVNLTSAQIVAYATGRSGRRLLDTPEIELPRPDPRSSTGR